MTTDAAARNRRSTLLATACLPVVVFFGWLMFGRLATCPKGIQADFVQEWTSARNFWTGRPIYLPLRESFPAYFGPHARTELRFNAHPPVAVLVALPFGRCDYRSAWLIWNVASLALLGASLWLLLPQSGLRQTAADAMPIVALLLASNPLAQQVIEGQMNLVLLALVVGAWAADRRQRQSLAGSLVGLAAAIKLYPAFLLVYFVMQRRWHAVAACGLSFLASNLVAAALFGGDVFVIYVRDVMPVFAHYGNNLANASLSGVCSKLLVGMPGLSAPLIAAPATASIANLVSGLVVALLCGWKVWRAKNRDDLDIGFSACLIGMLLASPITWGHGFVLLIMPLIIMWRCANGPIYRGLVATISVLLMLVRPGWIWNSFIPGFQAFTLGLAPPDYQVPPVYALTALSYLTYALVALFAVNLLLHSDEPAADAYRS